MSKVNRLIYVVNHKETGQAAGALYFQHEILEVRACQGVDSGKGFVHQKYDWLVCHGASYSDALLHTSPQLPGISAFESFTAELFQCCSSSFVQFASGLAGRRTPETCERTRKYGLAAARGANDAYELSLVKAQRDVLDRREGARSITV